MENPLSGWLGHATPFEFGRRYRPAHGIARMITGTPPVVSMALLETAVDIIAEAGMERLREKSMEMTSLLVDLIAQECPDSDLLLASPPEAKLRGSHITFAHPESYAIVQALKARVVIGDFRAPHFIQLGVAPIYLSYINLWIGVQHLKAVMHARKWDQAKFRTRATVT